METEEATEEGRDPGGTFTTTEDPTWSPPVSGTIGTAGAATMVVHQKETTWKTNPSPRSESGGQDNREWALEHSTPQKNNLMDHVPYTDSEKSEESSDHPTSSGISEASTS